MISYGSSQLNKLFECFSVPSVVWHHLHELLSRFLIGNMLRDIFIKSVFLNCKIVLFVLNERRWLSILGLI